MNQAQNAPPNAADRAETPHPEQEARDGGDTATAAPVEQPNGQEATLPEQAEPSDTVDAQANTC